MRDGTVRSLSDEERRRIGNMIRSPWAGPPSARGASRFGRSSNRFRERAARPSAESRHVRRRDAPVASIAPRLLELFGTLRFRTAFWGAATAWFAALTMALGALDVIPW